MRAAIGPAAVVTMLGASSRITMPLAAQHGRTSTSSSRVREQQVIEIGAPDLKHNLRRRV